MFQILETRLQTCRTNAVHIVNREGNTVVTIWDTSWWAVDGQDEMWNRAHYILDTMNQSEVSCER